VAYDAGDGFDLPHHRIPAHQLHELCSGGGGPETVRTLWKGQRSRRMLLLDTVRRALSDPADMGPLPPAALAWAAWAAAEEADPDAVASLLLHPQVGSWAAYALRRKRGRADADVELWVDAGVVHVLALVANARSGRSWRTSVPVRDGAVMLPTLGLAHLADGGVAVAEAECAAGEIRLRLGNRSVVVPAEADPDREITGWSPLRRLTGGREDPPFSVFLDDLDPFRELAQPVGADRLDAASVDRWRRLLVGAWQLLCRDHLATARAIAEGVVSLVPLPVDEFGITRSASSGEAFGSVLVSPPADEVDLAVALVHEFQHIKLGGLLHLLPLTEYDGDPVHHAPWRDDPRPVAGLLQGLYAFFGIADFWRLRRGASAGLYRRIVDFEFAYAWAQVQEVLATLSGSPSLTAVGRGLVDGLAERTRGWRAERVDPVASVAADLVCAAHRAEWRLRFVRPDGGQVKLLAAAWRTGSPAAFVPRTVVVPGAAADFWSLAWPAAARRHVAGRGGGPGPVTPEAALLAGDRDAAYESYRRAVAADPGDPHPWSGLSLTTSERLLRTRPEWVYAVCAELRADRLDADPVAVARWLEDNVPSLLLPIGAQDLLDFHEVR
jgi:HEXXH motif-containing protein